MDDKSALLNQLRIDRGASPQSQGSGPRRWWIAGALAALLVAGGLGWLLLRPSGVPVRAVVARAVSGDAGAAAGSLLDASGYVVARRQATVAAKITGKVTEVLIEEGRHVDADQIVGRLDDTNIRAQFDQARAQQAYAAANLEQIRVQLANAKRDYERKKALLAQHYVSQSDLDLAQTTYDNLKAQLATAERNVEVARQGVEVAQRNLDDTVIRAPFAGIVTTKDAQPGEIISPISAGGGFTRTGIGTIVDMDSLEVEVDVNESFINRVHAGQPAVSKLNAYPDWEIPSEVIAIIPTADRTKATVKVRVGLKQKDPRVLPDMGVRVSFLSEQPSAPSGGAAKPGVRVPNEAVQADGAAGVLYVIHEDRVERRAVRLGAPSADGQTVLSGLVPGERVAVGDFAKLNDGAKVRVEE